MANPVEIILSPPKRLAPTAMSLLESVDARIAEEGGLTVVSVPIDTEKYIVARGVGVVVTGGGAGPPGVLPHVMKRRRSKRRPSSSSNMPRSESKLP